jgi:hypothetical protein
MIIATTSNFKSQENLEKKTHQVVARIKESKKPDIFTALLTKGGYSSGSIRVEINATPKIPMAIMGRYKRLCFTVEGISWLIKMTFDFDLVLRFKK